MAEKTPRKGKWLRIAAWSLGGVLVVMAGAGFAAFKAYEPLLVYKRGWAPMPEADYPAVSQTAPEWADFGAEADAWLEQARVALNAPALSAAVSIDGEIVWAGAAGYADLDSLTPVTLDTAFRVGSSSKPVTAIGMGTLIEAGRVDLDAPASDYVARLSPPLADITTRQAMSHSAGVREYGACVCFPVLEYYSRTHYRTQRAALRPFEHDELLFAPGTGFSYSSYGYNLAGAVIEGVTGAPFGDFMQDGVFDPLGMTDTHLDDGPPHDGDATYYEVYPVEGVVWQKRVFRTDNTNRLPSGGVVASPSDMTRLGAQYIAPTLIESAARDTLIAPQSLANGDPMPQGYRLGIRAWREAPTPDGGTSLLLNHHGTAYGATSYFAIWPEYGLVVSAVINRNDDGAALIPEAGPQLERLAFEAIIARRAAGQAAQ